MAVSNRAWGMHIRLVCVCVCVVCCAGSGICDGLITRSEEFFRSCVVSNGVRDLETSRMRRPEPDVVQCSPYVPVYKRRYFSIGQSVVLADKEKIRVRECPFVH